MKKLSNVIEQIEIIHERLKLFIPKQLRPYYSQIDLEDIRDVIIYGGRGVGKTTFLLHKSLNKNFLYLSADNPIVSPYPLFDIAEAVFYRGYDGVIIDEVHFAKDWEINLKAPYDSFPNKYIWVSGSSSLSLKSSKADLSRRYTLFRIPLMSFREYIFLTKNIEVESINPFNFEISFLEKLQDINILSLFREYITSGIRPIFREGNYCQRLEGILEKSIFYDVPFFVPSVQDNHLRIINAILGHLIYSPIPTINISGMCSQWHISKEKLYNLLFVMEQAEIINIVRKKKDKNLHFTKGAKLFLSDPSVYSCFNGDKGSLREAFVVFSLKEKFDVFASDNESEYDYEVSGIKIEIGGKNKKFKKADFVIRDDIDIPVGNKIPMWLISLSF